MLGLRAGKIDHCMDALQAEMTPTLHALLFAANASMARIEMETDAINLKTMLTLSLLDLSSNGVMFQEIKNLYDH